MCRGGIADMLKTFTLFVEAKSTGTWFCWQSTISYSLKLKGSDFKWELFSCLLLLGKSKHQFCPVLLTVFSAMWSLHKQGRAEHHLYHFENLSGLLEMFVIALTKERCLSRLENYWSANTCLLNLSSVFRQCCGRYNIMLLFPS